jgi:hypothetical protein
MFLYFISVQAIGTVLISPVKVFQCVHSGGYLCRSISTVGEQELMVPLAESFVAKITMLISVPHVSWNI